MYRKLLHPLSETARSAPALATALMAARIFKAHLEAIIVQTDSREVAPLAGEGLSGAMIEEMIHTTERDSAERTMALQKTFTEATSGLDAATLDIHLGRSEDIVPALARLCDMTILPHPDAVEEDAASATLHAVLFESGRPVLIAPTQAPAKLGTRCCVAWNGTVESSASLWAMLPWLHQAEAVRVLYAETYQRRGPKAADVLPYLAMHGITAEIMPFTPVARNVGAGLLKAASDFGADLLGMGGYSHSRLRQLILGGVTRHVLQNAELAVMMSR